MFTTRFCSQAIARWVCGFLLAAYHKKHLSHGFSLPTKKVHLSSKLFEWTHFEYEEDGKFDYEAIARQAEEFKPKLIMVGYSAYPRHFDYKKLREIADKVNAILVADIAHICGLVATGNAPNCFEHCHVVSSTTHKTLRGPRGAIVWALQNHNGVSLINAVNESTFPGFQGGPHNHTIGAIATALKEASGEPFKAYVTQVVKNAKALAEGLKKRGYDLFTGGTDNHIVMMNLRSKGIDGGRVEHLFNQLDVSLNKNTLKGDSSAMRPSGIRLGSPAMTSRSLTEGHFDQIADFLHQGIQIATKNNSFKKNSEYNAHILKLAKEDKDLIQLRDEIHRFAKSFPFDYLPLPKVGEN